MSNGVTREESGEVLNEQSSVHYQALLNGLKQAGISDDYKVADDELDAERIAADLAEHKRLKEAQAKKVVPDQYDLSIPADIKHPMGHDWVPGKDDPEFVDEITKIFREAGNDQETVSKAVAAFAKHTVRKASAGMEQQKQALAQRKAEFEKLGPKGQERIDAIKQKLAGIYGQEGADAFFNGKSAKGIEVLEDLLAKADGAGRMAPTRPGAPGKRSNADLVGKKGGARMLLNAADSKGK